MKVNNSIKFIFKTYLLVLVIFSMFRLLLFLNEFERVIQTKAEFWTIIQSFLMGLRFDIVISGYLLALPTVILIVLNIVRCHNTFVVKLLFWYTYLLFSLAFFTAAADIPYFKNFYERFSIKAFEWFDHLDMVTSMLFEDPQFYLILLPFFLLEIVFYRILNKLIRPLYFPSPKISLPVNIGISILFLAVMFLGIRGRIQTISPIIVGTAYFSNNAFLNKLGLNPIFTLMRSYFDSRNQKDAPLNLIDKNLAIQNVQSYLSVNEALYNSPIARKIDFDSTLISKPNVVLVLMERMSAAKLTRHGNSKNLTPFLDSLSHKALYFENAYSTGKRTYNGIFSTLFSFPGIGSQHTMRKILDYDGIAKTLIDNGYSSSFFTTHDGQFDNIEGFLRNNHFQNIISQSNYPFDEVKTTYGVPDDYMFRYAIPYLNKMHKSNKPFFATLMTTSNHTPYYIPEYFSPKQTKIEDQIVEYADWSLNRFFTLASKEKWFENTLFVFVADHGVPTEANYDISLNYFHTPLLFYFPKYIENKLYNKMASQIDIYPTIMGILKQPYINNTLGIDLLNDQRKYAIIVDDDKMGVLDANYFCIMKNSGEKIELYRYKNKDRTDYYHSNKLAADAMVEYAKSHLQVHQEMVLTGAISLKK